MIVLAVLVFFHLFHMHSSLLNSAKSHTCDLKHSYLSSSEFLSEKLLFILCIHYSILSVFFAETIECRNYSVRWGTSQPVCSILLVSGVFCTTTLHFAIGREERRWVRTFWNKESTFIAEMFAFQSSLCSQFVLFYFRKLVSAYKKSKYFLPYFFTVSCRGSKMTKRDQLERIFVFREAKRYQNILLKPAVGQFTVV